MADEVSYRDRATLNKLAKERDEWQADLKEKEKKMEEEISKALQVSSKGIARDLLEIYKKNGGPEGELAHIIRKGGSEGGINFGVGDDY